MLLARQKVKPVTAIERLAGMQAQLPRPPFIGLWSRIEGFERRDLLRAIERRQVVRGTLMRGTIHYVSRRDYIRFRNPIQSALSQGMRPTGFRVDHVLDATRAFFEEEPRTFEEVRSHLAALYPNNDVRALAYFGRLHIPLVQVPDDSRWGYPASAKFTLAESWLGEPVADEESPESLALSYLAAFGPATAKDFQVWSFLPPATARGAFEALRPKLVALRDEGGRELFDLPRAPRPDEDTEAPVRFLPEYDNIVLAHADRTRIIADEHRKLIYTKNLVIPPMFLVDGEVAGRWKIERKNLTLDPFIKLSKKVKADLEEEADRLVAFVVK